MTKIAVESHDMTLLSKMDQAYAMVGGYDLPLEDQKPFGRIRGNDFSLADAERAVAIIVRRAAEMRTKAANTQVFLDPNLQKTWAEGVLASASLGERLAAEFIDSLHEDLATT